MLEALLVIAAASLVCLILLLFRKQPAAQQDPRFAQIPDQLTRIENQIRSAFTEMRSELKTDASALRTEITASITTLGTTLKNDLNSFRKDNEDASLALRGEVIGNITGLGSTLTTALANFGEENKDSAEKLRNDVEQKMRSISQNFTDFKNETSGKHIALQESLNQKLIDLMNNNATHQDKLRTAVEDRLTKLNEDNSKELERMRQTVDEKLSETLQTRLTESFGQVTDQLNKVHSGLGEMTKLSDGVNDLSRIFTNVKSRGGFAEIQLGMLLEQMLAPSQFIRNAKVKEGSQEVVEFAVRFPGHSGETLLPIDAKFPREDWERLESAYESNIPENIISAGKAFEAAIRTEGERICKKYINPPVTTPHAIMFLPTEGLYAEVMRRDSLQAEVQSKCQVTIAGPSTLSAILTSFQMGFQMLALQEKGDEVWKVLQSAKTEFGKFGTLMDKVGNDLLKVHGKIADVGVRTRAINRTLRDVGEADRSLPASQLIDFDQAAGITTFLAASSDEE